MPTKIRVSRVVRSHAGIFLCVFLLILFEKMSCKMFFKLCSVTIFLTDLDGTVTQHDCNFLAVDGFPFFDGDVLAVDGKSNFDGIFAAVTQHDGKFLAEDGFSFFDGQFLPVDGKSNFDGIFTAVTQHDGRFLAVDGKSSFDGIFTAVTQHDGKLPAADGFRFVGAASKWPNAKHISST